LPVSEILGIRIKKFVIKSKTKRKYSLEGSMKVVREELPMLPGSNHGKDNRGPERIRKWEHSVNQNQYKKVNFTP